MENKQNNYGEENEEGAINEILEKMEKMPPTSEQELRAMDYMDDRIGRALVEGKINNGELDVVYKTRKVTHGPEQGYDEQRDTLFYVVEIGENHYAIIDKVNPERVLHVKEQRFVQGTLEEAIKTADGMIDARENRTLKEERERERRDMMKKEYRDE